MAAATPVRQVRKYRNLQREYATYRALIGAELLLGLSVKPTSLAHAAMMVGSSPQYVAGMRTLIEANAWSLVDAVMFDQVPLRGADDSMRKRAQLIQSYRTGDAIDRQALGEIEGVDKIWDEVLAPNL
jgi:hypothetical protein